MALQAANCKLPAAGAVAGAAAADAPCCCCSPAACRPAGWVVLGLPPGVFTLERQVVITRPYTILRGAGRDRTTLFLPNSMFDLYGALAGGRRGGLA